MKLLTRTSIYYFIFSSLVFVIGGFIFYQVIEAIFYRQLDDTLLTEKRLIEEQINFSDSLPDFGTVFGHMIQVTILNSPLKEDAAINDTVISTEENPIKTACRHLFISNTSVRKKGYIIHIFKPLKETENLITAILLAMTILFISLMLLLIVMNYFVSRTVWIPFHKTLKELSQYNFHQEEGLSLPATGITEFRSLNATLDTMSRKIRRDFLNLKEFNENASHELQTPLAIIKSKLELLIQNENLSSEQIQHLTSVYDSANRISKLNQGLLLISKIENNQFSEKEEIDLLNIVNKHLENFDEILKMKSVTVSFETKAPFIVQMNKSLAEILISNLFSNAIKHNVEGGNITISMTDKIFSITNTGHQLNVPPDKLFQRFSKSERTSESVGLGLAIVKQIVEFYHLDIQYQHQKSTHKVIISFSQE